MLATASTTTEVARPAGRTHANWFGGRRLIVAWTVWAVGCVVFMFMLPGGETIPYHLGWAGFALAFGLGTWSRGELVFSLAWFTLVTGFALERSWLLGQIGVEETSEIPLMFLLAVLMVWHVRRRQGALAHVTRLAERDVQASHDRAPLATKDRKGRPQLVTPAWPVMVKEGDHEVASANFFVSVARREEKGSDVSVASHLLIDVFEQTIDAAVVFSNDSDWRSQ